MTEKRWYAGVDWASESHHVFLTDGEGRRIGEKIFKHSGEGLAEMAAWLMAASGMSRPASKIIAPCSRPSTPLRPADCGGLRPALTAAVRGASQGSGRDGETPSSRTEKHPCSYGSPILLNLTHITHYSQSLYLMLLSLGTPRTQLGPQSSDPQHLIPGASAYCLRDYASNKSAKTAGFR